MLVGSVANLPARALREHNHNSESKSPCSIEQRLLCNDAHKRVIRQGDWSHQTGVNFQSLLVEP
jgi:hypothetical protein